MAESRGELELYNQWFVLADADKDGVVSGNEAVRFFAKSGLPTNPTLFKVWQYVAGDRPSLNRQEFYTSMKLVSLAQLNGGVLDDAAALRLVNGLAGAVPPPQLQGLPVPAELVPGGGFAPPGRAVPSPGPGQVPPRPPSAAGSASGVPGSATPSPGFAPLSAEQAAAFSTAFQQLDGDRDGLVQGTDCFPVFIRSGLSKEALRVVWDLVAGSAGALSGHQFTQALYLIEHAKAGKPLPTTLPPGQFPPVTGTLDVNALTGAGASRGDIFAGARVPALPPRATFDPAAVPAGATGSAFSLPAVPVLSPTGLAAAPPGERERLEAERSAVETAAREAAAAEAARAAAAARARFYTESLAELRLAGSALQRALVEAQQRSEMEGAAAEAAEADYDAAYTEFSRQHAAAGPAVAAAQAAAERHAALTARLAALREAVAGLEAAAEPGAAARDAAEAEAAAREVAALEARRVALEAGAAEARGRAAALDGVRTQLVAAADAAAAQLPGLQTAIEELTAAAAPAGDAVLSTLRSVAGLYEQLYRAARTAMLPLPAEALAGLKREALPLAYNGVLAAGAADWGGFEDAGFTIVSVLPPDERLQTLAVTPDAAAAEAAAAAAATAASAGDTGAEFQAVEEKVSGIDAVQAQVSKPPAVDSIETGVEDVAPRDAKAADAPASAPAQTEVAAAPAAAVDPMEAVASSIASAFENVISLGGPGSKPATPSSARSAADIPRPAAATGSVLGPDSAAATAPASAEPSAAAGELVTELPTSGIKDGEPAAATVEEPAGHDAGWTAF